MNTFTAALCKQPAIGVAMWLVSLCVTNQALRDQFVDLGSEGTVLSTGFDAPMDELHTLRLVWRRDAGRLCESQAALKVTLRLSTPGAPSFRDTRFEVACPALRQLAEGALVLGTVPIRRGPHRVELINHTPLAALAGQRVQVLLTGQGAGFP